MRNKITISESDVTSNQRIKTSDQRSVFSPGLTGKKSSLEILSAEGNEDFANYVEWLGFSEDPNLVVLSSVHHYYYDEEEMKNVRTIVSLIELNKIKKVTGFINSIFHLLPSKSYFIGCFVDNKKQKRFALRDKTSDYHSKRNSHDVENGITSRFPFLNMIFSYIDSKTNKYLSGKYVTLLLRNSGFKVIDMTEFNGVTYFCAQKLLKVVE